MRPTALRPEAALAWLLLLGAAVRVVAGWGLGLGYGESYHFTSARHPSLGYLDHPPLFLWITWLTMHLTGRADALVLRAPFILLFAGTTWLMFLLGRRLFGAWPGFYAALLLNLSAVFTLPVAGWVQADGPLMFFWLLTALCLATIFFEPRLRRPLAWWAGAGIALGLALLAKYHAVFLVLGVATYVLTWRPALPRLRHPGPYLALALAMAVFSPVLIWNTQHGWISFLWQGSRGVHPRGFRLDWLARSIGGQALWLLPWIWVPLLMELARSFRRGRQDARRWFLAWMAVGPIVTFTAVAVYAPLGFHFHWQAPGYLMLFPALGETVDRLLRAGGRAARRTRQWLGASAALTCLALVLVVTHATTGWWRSLGPRQLSAFLGEPEDPTLEGLDWQGLEEALARHGLLHRKDVFVFSNRWFQSGKVDYALRGRKPVLNLHWDARNLAFLNRTENWLGKDGVLVTTARFREEALRDLPEYFRQITRLDEVTVSRGGRPEVTLYLYYCTDLRKPYPLPYP